MHDADVAAINNTYALVSRKYITSLRHKHVL